MKTLLLADLAGIALADATAKALTAALSLGQPVHILVAGENVGEAARQAATFSGVEKVLVADTAIYAHQMAEPLAALLLSLSGSYAAFVGSATSVAKSVMPRVAAKLDVMQVSEITRVVDPTTFERPIYAGNAIQTVRSSDKTLVMTVRTAAFGRTPASDDAPAPVEAIGGTTESWHPRFKNEAVSRSDRPELTSAKIIVSGGRAMQSAENFKTYLEPVADKLNAAIGASRAAVDSGFAPNDWQVGQTGKVVAPDLYVAVGISGAIQHLAGMKDSRVIVAINKDEEAPIFQVADYGLAADLFTALPELRAELEKERK